MNLEFIITTAIAIIGVILLYHQLSLANKTLKADHERRKKQATVEYLNAIRPFWNESEKVINAKYGSGPLTIQQVLEFENHPAADASIKSLLSLLEHMSVGMNTGVFDKDLLYRMSASYLINIYERLSCYIKEAQKKNRYRYIEFEEIIRDFKNRKAVKLDPRGNIVHS